MKKNIISVGKRSPLQDNRFNIISVDTGEKAVELSLTQDVAALLLDKNMDAEEKNRTRAFFNIQFPDTHTLELEASMEKNVLDILQQKLATNFSIIDNALGNASYNVDVI